jgi:hypothetical protein
MWPGKHHQAYLDNMNKQIAGSNLESKSLVEVVLESWNNGSPTPVFNNAAQVRTASSRLLLSGSSSSTETVDTLLCSNSGILVPAHPHDILPELPCLVTVQGRTMLPKAASGVCTIYIFHSAI